MKTSLLKAAFGTVLLASGARASEAFGPENSISIRSSIPLAIYTHTKPATGDSVNEFTLGPKMSLTAFAVDYWLNKDVTLGGALQYGNRSAAPESWSLLLAPSIGYRYTMSDMTLWPKIQPYYSYSSATVASVESTASKFGVGLELPILYSRGTFFYGPVLSAQFDFTSTVKTAGASSDGPLDTNIGVGFQVGSTY